MAAGLVIGLSAIVLSGSRGPLLALLVSGLLLLPAAMREWPRRRALELRLVSLGALAVGYLLVRQGGRLELLRRLLAVVTGSSEPSFDDRVVRWQNAWQTFLAHPWTGAGTTPADYYPHNLMLEALQGSGVVAGLLIGSLYALGGVRVFSEVRAPGRVHWTTLLWVQFAVHTLFSGAVWDVTAFWVLSAALAGAEGSESFSAAG
jgi:O-antigen ligase